MAKLNQIFHDVEGKLLVWVSLVYGFLSVISEIFNIQGLQSLYRDPKFFVPAISFFLFLISRYILSLNNYVSKIDQNNKSLSLIKKDILFIKEKSKNYELDRYWNYCLSQVEEGIYSLSRKNTILVGKDHAQQFWRRLLVKPSSAWFCTDIMRKKEKWGYGWKQETALGFQTYAIEEGAEIRRIFIIENDSSLSENKDEFIKNMEAHENIGVGVRWITPENMSTWISLNLFQERLGTIDFAIADQKYILSFHFDDNLIHKEVTLVKNKLLSKELHAAYKTLWLACKPISELLEWEQDVNK